MTYQIGSTQIVTTDSVGEWGGLEEQVATNLNKINEAIADRLDVSDDDGFDAATSEAADKFGAEEWLGHPLADELVDALAAHIVVGSDLPTSVS